MPERATDRSGTKANDGAVEEISKYIALSGGIISFILVLVGELLFASIVLFTIAICMYFIDKRIENDRSNVAPTNESSTVVSDDDLRKIKLIPEIECDEISLFFTTYRHDSTRVNSCLLVTNKNIFIRPKKGSGNSGPIQDSNLEQMQTLRKKGDGLVGEVEVETNTETIHLPKLPKKDVDLIVSSLVNSMDLVRRDKKESKTNRGKSKFENTVRAAFGVVGAISTISSFLLGLFFAVVGLIVSLSIVGALIGVPLIILGIILAGSAGMSGALSSKSLSGISTEQKEWVRSKDGDS